MSENSKTPDLLPRFNRKDRFDQKPSGGGRSLAPEIDHNALGPSCHLDSAQGGGRHGGHLGTGSDSVADAAGSIASGAKASGVNWGLLMRTYRK